MLGLSHKDLLCSHLHISILARPALSLSPCLMEGDVIMLPGVAMNVATEGWGVQPVDKTVAAQSRTRYSFFLVAQECDLE